MRPVRMTAPMSAPRMPVTASGPGVGGTMWWVSVMPHPSASASVTYAPFFTRAIERASGFMMT